MRKWILLSLLGALALGGCETTGTKSESWKGPARVEAGPADNSTAPPPPPTIPRISSREKEIRAFAKAWSLEEKDITLIRQKKVKVGWPAQLAEMSWGKPLEKSKTVTRFGNSEVWTYGEWASSMIFIENGWVESVTTE